MADKKLPSEEVVNQALKILRGLAEEETERRDEQGRLMPILFLQAGFNPLSAVCPSKILIQVCSSAASPCLLRQLYWRLVPRVRIEPLDG